jgi:tetratricopeptide (TPR) repeat protein
MEPTISVLLALGSELVKRLESGELTRFGGVIREAATGRTVALLREVGSNAAQIPQRLQQAEALLQVGSAASVLGLGVSVMGFAVINQRLNELEKRLKQAEELLKKIDRKIDLGNYANFKAALGLASNAFKMSQSNNRRDSALQAINRFLEAEHIYADYTDKELEQKSQVADEYLLTLCLAYIAEARCYLELGEHDTALHRFQQGSFIVRERIQKYIELLLTSNPAAYLQPHLKEQTDLRRLTRIYQWIDPTLDENAVFQMQRENLFKMAQEPNKWVESLPPAIVTRLEVKGGLFGVNQGDLKREADKRLPEVLEVMESMVETNRRFEAYQAEVTAIKQLGISFHDWLQLASTKKNLDGAELIYIIPSKPIQVAVA